MPTTSRRPKRKKESLYHMKKITPKTIRRQNRDRLAAQKKGMNRRRSIKPTTTRTKSKGKGTKRRRRRRRRKRRRRKHSRRQ